MHATPLSMPAVKRLLHIAFGAALLVGAGVYTSAHAQLPPVEHQGSVEYISGGIGIDESTAFKAAMSQYPLALTFANQIGNEAAYVADVQVVIRDKQGNTALNAESKGPYFLVKLPAGQYEVFATYNNQTQSRKVNVGASGTQSARFDWK